MGRSIIVIVIACLTSTDVTAQFRQSTLQTVPVIPRTRVESGVNVFEHDQTAFARATQLELVGAPITIAGGSHGNVAYDLTHASSVALLSDGRIATLSAIGSKFFIFAPDGRPQRQIGRQGKGPGEFMRPDGLVMLNGDTVFLSDGSNARYNWVLADKGVVRTRSMVAGNPWARGVGVFPTGEIVSSTGGRLEDHANSAKRSPANIVVTGADDKPKTVATLSDLDMTELELNFGRGQSKQSVALGYTRRAIVEVWGTVLATGNGEGYRIDMRNRNGTVHSRITVAVPRVIVTQPMREAYIEASLEQYRGTRGEGLINRGESERIARATPFADSLPPYIRFFTSPNKTLWVVDGHSLIDKEWFATAFRADGVIIGRLRMSGTGMPMAFGDDRVVIRNEDDDGVVSMVVRKIGVVKEAQSRSNEH